jgi:hypothetical protein
MDRALSVFEHWRHRFRRKEDTRKSRTDLSSQTDWNCCSNLNRILTWLAVIRTTRLTLQSDIDIATTLRLALDNWLQGSQ